MKITFFTLTIAIWLMGAISINAQDLTEGNSPEVQEQIDDLQVDRASIVEREKKKLSNSVAKINTRLENGEITMEEAELLKVASAEEHALNIENKLAIIDNRLALLNRNGEDYNTTSIRIKIGSKRSDSYVDSDNRYKRTYSATTVAIGLNNTLIDGQSLDDSPYRIGGSRFFEIGHSWNTRVFKNQGWLRLKYGFSFQFNGLKPEGNRSIVVIDDVATLEEFPVSLDKSKIRQDNLVIPVHFEFGPSKRVEKDGKTYFSDHQKFKVGLGGFAGLNLTTIQKLKFDDGEENIKQKTRLSSATNSFVYGVSGYIGWDTMSLYVKYDLNPIFKNGPEQKNISAGVRFDFD